MSPVQRWEMTEWMIGWFRSSRTLHSEDGARRGDAGVTLSSRSIISTRSTVHLLCAENAVSEMN